MRRKNIIWGGFLILLGIFFLLDNLGIIHLNFWSVFWPLLLITFGLQMLWGARGRQSTTFIVEEATMSLKGIEEAHIQVNYGAGELNIDGETAPDELLSGTFGGGLDYKTEEDGDIMHLELFSPRKRNGRWRDEERNWDFGLNNAIPMTLDVKVGASEAILDLAQLNLSQFHLKTGASDAQITLPTAASYTDCRIETGAASVVVTVPIGVAARIRTKKGLADVNIDQTRFLRTNGQYESVDYATAENKVDINISVGVGSVIVQ